MPHPVDKPQPTMTDPSASAFRPAKRKAPQDDDEHSYSYPTPRALEYSYGVTREGRVFRPINNATGCLLDSSDVPKNNLGPCCGLNCNNVVDGSHWCIFCESNCHNFCKLRNADDSDWDDNRKWVICNCHEDIDNSPRSSSLSPSPPSPSPPTVPPLQVPNFDSNDELDEERHGLYAHKASAFFHCQSIDSEEEYNVTLLTMALAPNVSIDERQYSRFQEYVKKKWLKQSNIRVMQKHLYAETQRRWNVLMVMETTNGEKMPGTSKWKNADFERYLLNEMPLCASDRMFVVTEISTVLDGIKKESEEKVEEERRTGNHISMTTVQKMRIIEALLLEEHCDVLVNSFNALNRKGLDDRNSSDRDKNIYELVREKVNNADWVPTSLCYPSCHGHFNTAIELKFPDKYIVMDLEAITRTIKDFYSLFKSCHSNWQASGNGKDNLNQDSTRKYRIRFTGISYNENGTGVEDEENEDNTIPIRHVSDDCFNFCQKSLSIAYFWCRVDEIGLCLWVMQNIDKIALTHDRPAQQTLGATASNRNNARRRQQHNIDDVFEKLPSLIMRLMSDYNKTTSNNTIELEEQQRRAMQYLQNWYAII